MLRRVTNLAFRRGRTDKEYRASAPPVQAIRPWTTEPSETSDSGSLDGIAAAVASLAHGQAPAVTTDRIALTSGAKNDSAVQDILNTAEDGTDYQPHRQRFSPFQGGWRNAHHRSMGMHSVRNLC